MCTQRHKKKAESFEKNALEKIRETEAVSPAGRVKNKKKKKTRSNLKSSKLRDSLSPGTPDLTYQGTYLGIYIIMAKTNKFNVPNGLMNQGKVADIPEFPFF